jgi:hypothetical protein
MKGAKERNRDAMDSYLQEQEEEKYFYAEDTREQSKATYKLDLMGC